MSRAHLAPGLQTRRWHPIIQNGHPRHARRPTVRKRTGGVVGVSSSAPGVVSPGSAGVSSTTLTLPRRCPRLGTAIAFPDSHPGAIRVLGDQRGRRARTDLDFPKAEARHTVAPVVTE